MDGDKPTMPRPACPPDCPHLSPTCRPICKTWKDWQREHKPPRPKVTETDRYLNKQHNKITERIMRKRK